MFYLPKLILMVFLKVILHIHNLNMKCRLGKVRLKKEHHREKILIFYAFSLAKVKYIRHLPGYIGHKVSLLVGFTYLAHRY